MTAIVVNGATTFGAMSNRAVALLYALNEEITRVNSAIAAAASGYAGTAGTEYEGNSTNFGVAADATAGQQGAAWAYAFQELATQWNTFFTNATTQASIEALDNGVTIQP